jgi:hypothetical protein
LVTAGMWEQLTHLAGRHWANLSMFTLVTGFAADGPAVDRMKHHLLDEFNFQTGYRIGFLRKNSPREGLFRRR